jgi:hypothetical protein
VAYPAFRRAIRPHVTQGRAIPVSQAKRPRHGDIASIHFKLPQSSRYEMRPPAASGYRFANPSERTGNSRADNRNGRAVKAGVAPWFGRPLTPRAQAGTAWDLVESDGEDPGSGPPRVHLGSTGHPEPAANPSPADTRETASQSQNSEQP